MPSPPIDSNYSLDREQVSWMGLDITQAMAEGDGAFTEEAQGDQGWTQKDNGVGGAVQSFNPSTRGMVKIKISLEHPIHLSLKNLVKTDQLTRAVAGPMQRQRNSGEVIKYENARLTRLPNESAGTVAGTVDWEWIYTRRVSNAPAVPANVIAPASTP